MSKIEKTIARQQEKYSFPLPSQVTFLVQIPADFYFRIAEGQFYEAHQQLRVVASRYVKSSKWDAAIDILHGGALALLKAGQGGSGGDLGLYLLEVYVKAEIGVDAGNKGTYAAVQDLTYLEAVWQVG